VHLFSGQNVQRKGPPERRANGPAYFCFHPSGQPWQSEFDEGDNETISYIALIGAAVSVVTLVVSALGTASAVTLGWRADRRQSEELKLKIQQMELQIAEMRRKADAGGLTTN
jgi:hypothetical protein